MPYPFLFRCAAALSHSFAWLLAIGCSKPATDQRASVASPEVTAAIVSGTPGPARFGEPATNPYFEVRLLNSKPCAVETHFPSAPGTRKVAVEIELRAVGAQEIPANPFYALLVDRDGRAYESTLAGCPPLLPAQRLGRGQSARGWVTFDVPEGVEARSLVYQPAVIGVAAPKAELSLEP